MMVNLRGKRGNKNYRQISGYIPKNQALRLKAICAVLEIDQSQALEEMVTAWLEGKQHILDKTQEEDN